MQRHVSYVAAEISVLFLLATAAIAVLVRVRSIPFFQNNTSTIAAVLFLYLPAIVIWHSNKELSDYGFNLFNWKQSLILYLISIILIYPTFFLGYWVLAQYLCPSFHLPTAMFACGPQLRPRLRWTADLAQTVLGQMLVVALPEEFFFRGYIQSRMQVIVSPFRALVLSALLFALGHLLVTFQPSSLAVFFPGLVFGLLRFWSGSIVAGTMFHASCNIFIDVLHRTMG